MSKSDELKNYLKNYSKSKSYTLIPKNNIKDQYFEILSQITDEGEEQEFITNVGAIYNIPVMFDQKEIREQIDHKKIEQLGLQKFMDKDCLPLKDNRFLAYNPFVDMYNIVLTTRNVMLQVTNKIKGQYERIIITDEGGNIEDFLREVLQEAYIQKCSDIHIEYEPARQASIIKYRREGILEKVKDVGTLTAHELLVNKIFEIAGSNANDFLRIHDKKITFELFQKNIPIRVSAIPVNVTGERKVSNIVLRLLAGNVEITTTNFESLGYFSEDTALIENIIKLPYGLVIVSGPTGSGKTTLLYTMLLKKAKEPIKILTIEDPIESILPGVMQTEVRESTDNPKDSITFSSAVRAFLRHDPDVILIGEVRDRETAEEAVRASITGHLVFTTLHANTTIGSIMRMIDLGVDRTVFADAIKYIIAQRLVRRLCVYCRIQINAMDEEQLLKHFKMDRDMFETNYKQFRNLDFYVENPNGCEHCRNGFSGRVAIYEILEVNESILEALLQGRSLTHKEAFSGQESRTFNSISTKKILEGQTTIKEVERYIMLG